MTVLASNPATKSAHNAVTADDGTFTLTLPPGTYTITATVQGFRRAVQTVDITADAWKQVDFTLDAALSQEVTVTALKRESSMLDVPFSIAAPTEQVSATPRVVYQTVRMDGWNRIDLFHILANPYTTTRPKVTLDERQQFTQLEEAFTDGFVLVDLNMGHRLGDIAVTSVTSYAYRDVLVVRDATALTASITGGSIGLPASAYTLNAPLNDTTNANTWSQELRFSGTTSRFPWVAGAFYSRQDRDYDQDLQVTGFEAVTGIPTRGLRAPTDSLYWSDLGYTLVQFALFGEGTLSLTPELVSRRGCATTASTKTRNRSSTASSATTITAARWCRSREPLTLTGSRRG